jgi:ribosomal-protein-alanine N-acetyltransferase
MKGVDIRRLKAADVHALADLFEVLAADATAAHYRPHAMTPTVAHNLATYRGDDVYLGAWVDGALVGYGMLRGWDSGYLVPSLGIYIRPEVRGTGLADRLMTALHAESAMKGAERVRLRVAPHNTRAKRLYDRCGYQFDGTVERDELVGVKVLQGTAELGLRP